MVAILMIQTGPPTETLDVVLDGDVGVTDLVPGDDAAEVRAHGVDPWRADGAGAQGPSAGSGCAALMGKQAP